MSKLIFLDTETTGVDTDRCGMFQIAGSIDIDGKEVDNFNYFCDIFPEDLIVPEALEINKVTEKKIHSFVPPVRAFNLFQGKMAKYVDKYDKKDKFIVVAYIADFDNRVLRRWFKMNGDSYFGSWFWVPWIDVAVLAAYTYQDRRSEIENFKQGTLAKFMGIKFDDNSLHDSQYDLGILKQIYYKLAEGD